jgi:hypothetical protein
MPDHAFADEDNYVIVEGIGSLKTTTAHRTACGLLSAVSLPLQRLCIGSPVREFASSEPAKTPGHEGAADGRAQWTSFFHGQYIKKTAGCGKQCSLSVVVWS